MTSNTVHVRSNSSLTNFKDWAQSISSWMSTIGWVQTADTGQVNWSTIVSVPTAGNYVYEIWKPGDALTVFYVKMEYGTNTASTNTGPSMRLSYGTSTDGAGTLTGVFSSTQIIPFQVVSVTSNSTQYNCYYSGDASYFAIMMWRDDPTASAPVCFGVQRSLNASGAYTSSFVTMFFISSSSGTRGGQFTLIPGVGVQQSPLSISNGGGLQCSKNSFGTYVSGLFNGNVPVYPLQPEAGQPLNVHDVVMLGYINDFTEGSTYTLSAGNMPYGVSHTYLASKASSVFSNCGPGSSANTCLLMRYD